MDRNHTNDPISVIEFTSDSFISQIYRGKRTVNMIHQIKETIIINPKICVKADSEILKHLNIKPKLSV